MRKTSLATVLVILSVATSAQQFSNFDTMLRHTKSWKTSARLRQLRARRSLLLQTHKADLRNTASPDVNWIQCPLEAQDLGGQCGTLPVPFDRRHPETAKIDIYFELYLHTNPGPAESAILANPGGPGASTTVLRGLALTFFGPNLDAHDILLIDDRGRGFSDPIDCSELQHESNCVTVDSSRRSARSRSSISLGSAK